MALVRFVLENWGDLCYTVTVNANQELNRNREDAPMKRLILVFTAALLLLSSCEKAPEPEQTVMVPEPEAPAAVSPEQAGEPSTETETEPAPAPEPAPVPETPSEEEPAADTSEKGVTVRMDEQSGSVEESASYHILVPVLEGSGGGTEAINAYYKGVADRLTDMAYGEVYEQSLDRNAILQLVGDCSVKRNDGRILSIRRTVAVYDMRSGTGEFNTGVQYSDYAETFDLETGGLLTPGDIFDAERAVYTERLVDNVTRYIREHPDRGWFSGWDTLAEERFDPDRFYLTDDCYVVWYEAGELCGESMEFAIPWRQLADILKIEV